MQVAVANVVPKLAPVLHVALTAVLHALKTTISANSQTSGCLGGSPLHEGGAVHVRSGIDHKIPPPLGRAATPTGRAPPASYRPQRTVSQHFFVVVEIISPGPCLRPRADGGARTPEVVGKHRTSAASRCSVVTIGRRGKVRRRREAICQSSSSGIRRRRGRRT
jgi:hypothetical protein